MSDITILTFTTLCNVLMCNVKYSIYHINVKYTELQCMYQKSRTANFCICMYTVVQKMNPYYIFK